MQPKTPAAVKQSTKTHRRSRTGCFTCRLRRKKCDEGKPSCRACKHLGLACEYKRPQWWGNVDQRKRQKETIKMMIKRTKLSEKAVHLSPAPSADSPPELSRSLPTSDSLSESMPRNRSVSIDSGYPLFEPDVNLHALHALHAGHFAHQPHLSHLSHHHHLNLHHHNANLYPQQQHPQQHQHQQHQHPHQQQHQQQQHQQHQQHHHNQQQQQQHYTSPPPPYDYEVYTQQKETFVIPQSRRSSSTASFASSSLRRSSMASVVQADQPSAAPPFAGADAGDDTQFFDYQQYAAPPPPPVAITPPPPPPPAAPSASAQPPSYIPVEGHDRQLLDHFLGTVQQLLFPILSLHGTARQELILPALASNECYRHCCLSIAALHIKTTQHLAGAAAEWVDQDITRHRYKTISGLCEALAKDADHLQILEAALGMILFQCSVGTPTDSLPDIPWHQHFQAAISLVNKLDLTRFLQPLSRAAAPPSAPPAASSSLAPPPASAAPAAPALAPTLNMTLTAWIDILGATMLGRAPQFADTYREKHLSCGASGLRELMGCDDRVMYLISEIACLESLRDQGMLTDMDLCIHVESLAQQIDLTEDASATAAGAGASEGLMPVVQNGAVDPRALTAAMTSAFRSAARIYLCGLVPGFDRTQPQVTHLLDKLTACLETIPGGPDGFDRSLVWVLLVAGSVAGPASRFRAFFRDRCARLGEDASYGSFGRMERVLAEVWAIQDHNAADTHWRAVMAAKGWDCLLV